MRVFSAEEVKSAAEERAGKDAIRARNTALLIDDLLKEKVDAETAFEESMARQRSEFDAAYQLDIARRKSLEEEVKELEKRKEEALRQLLLKADDIHLSVEAIGERSAALKAEKDSLEDTSRVLMRRIDEVSTKEDELKAKEDRLKRKELNADSISRQAQKEMQFATNAMQELNRKVSEQEISNAYKQSELDAQEELHKEKAFGFQKREEEIQASMRLLQDQRILLQKGFDELRKIKQKL